VKVFICVKLILLGYVSESGTSLNVLHIWIGWKKVDGKLTGCN